MLLLGMLPLAFADAETAVLFQLNCDIDWGGRGRHVGLPYTNYYYFLNSIQAVRKHFFDIKNKNVLIILTKTIAYKEPAKKRVSVWCVNFHFWIDFITGAIVINNKSTFKCDPYSAEMHNWPF